MKHSKYLYLELLSLVCLGAFAPEIQAVDVVYANITCPATTYFKKEYDSKIGSDPALNLVSPGVQRPTIPFKVKSRTGQKITCIYDGPGNEVVTYAYTVERHINDCTSKDARTFVCEVKK